MKGLEYTRFATVTIYVAQILSGLTAVLAIIMGVIRLVGDSIEGLKSIASGIVLLGIFFALSRILNIDNPDKEG